MAPNAVRRSGIQQGLHEGSVQSAFTQGFAAHRLPRLCILKANVGRGMNISIVRFLMLLGMRINQEIPLVVVSCVASGKLFQ